jgi:hypothetical protein
MIGFGVTNGNGVGGKSEGDLEHPGCIVFDRYSNDVMIHDHKLHISTLFFLSILNH